MTFEPSIHWDKELSIRLRKEGLSVEQAGMVVGIVAEHRQEAYTQGHHRGFNAGYDEGFEQVLRKTYPQFEDSCGI